MVCDSIPDDLDQLAVRAIVANLAAPSTTRCRFEGLDPIRRLVQNVRPRNAKQLSQLAQLNH